MKEKLLMGLIIIVAIVLTFGVYYGIARSISSFILSIENTGYYYGL